MANCFAYVVTALDTHKPKPSPEAPEKTRQSFDVQICDCAIVGDSVSEVPTGSCRRHNCGGVVRAFSTLDELLKENPDFILKDASELPKIHQVGTKETGKLDLRIGILLKTA